MQVRTSKEITDRQKAATYVLSVFQVQGPSVADELAELFRPHFEPGEDPGYAGSISSSARTLRAAIADAIAADEAHYAEKAKLSGLIEERSRIVASLKRLLVGLRRTVLGQHDQADLGRLGFGGETAREPIPLLRQAERIIAVLDGGDLDDLLGEPLFSKASFDPEPFHDEIRQAAKKLRSFLDRIGEVRREAERAYLHKKQKTKLYDRLFLREARGFADWCRLVGRGELADRIRPSSSRPGRTETEPPDPELSRTPLGAQIQEHDHAGSRVREAVEDETQEIFDSQQATLGPPRLLEDEANRPPLLPKRRQPPPKPELPEALRRPPVHKHPDSGSPRRNP